MTHLTWTKHEPDIATFHDWPLEAIQSTAPDPAPDVLSGSPPPLSLEIEGTVVPPESLALFPYRSVGRLLYEREGARWSGSAFVLAVGPHMSVIMTAAHCVRRGEHWARKFYFSPQQHGPEPGPHGWWTVDLVYETGPISDLAVGRTLSPPGRPTPLPPVGQVVDRLPVGRTAPRNTSLRWRALGYPGRSGPDEGKMFECAGSWVRDLSDTIMEMANDLGSGSSGGPWVQLVEPGRDLVTGVSSRGLDATVSSFVFTPEVVSDLTTFPPA